MKALGWAIAMASVLAIWAGVSNVSILCELQGALGGQRRNCSLAGGSASASPASGHQPGNGGVGPDGIPNDLRAPADYKRLGNGPTQVGIGHPS